MAIGPTVESSSQEAMSDLWWLDSGVRSPVVGPQGPISRAVVGPRGGSVVDGPRAGSPRQWLGLGLGSSL